jgi:hypothetical protein
MFRLSELNDEKLISRCKCGRVDASLAIPYMDRWISGEAIRTSITAEDGGSKERIRVYASRSYCEKLRVSHENLLGGLF